MTDQTILSIRRPDDWHLHFRDGVAMRSVVPFTAKQFARAIVMPNLSPPVTTVEAGAAYRDRILAAVPEGVAACRVAGVVLAAGLVLVFASALGGCVATSAFLATCTGWLSFSFSGAAAGRLGTFNLASAGLAGTFGASTLGMLTTRGLTTSLGRIRSVLLVREIR